MNDQDTEVAKGDLSLALDWAKRIDQLILGHTNSIWLPDNPQPTDGQKLAAACYMHVLEHCSSIILLIENNNVGSALALLRPSYEALVTGLFLAFAAKEGEVKCFEEQRISKLLKNRHYVNRIKNAVVEQTEDEDRQRIERIFDILSHEIKVGKGNIDFLNSFTHGGYDAIHWRLETNQDDSKSVIYRIENATGLLLVAVELAAYAAWQIARFLGNSELEQEMLGIIDSLSEEKK